MKPTVKIASTRTPDGGELALFQHDLDFSIMINGQPLMQSRQHESERELARLGCAHLAGSKAPCVLVGGLGMGFTLRQALDMLSHNATVVVSELLDDVVQWNRGVLGALNGHPLQDKRVNVQVGDLTEILAASEGRFDAILLDIDNGPAATTDSANGRLYSQDGMQACRRALRKRGVLAIWSSGPSKPFEHLLMRCGFQVRRFRVPAYKGSKSASRFVWVAAEDRSLLPAGGGEPTPPSPPQSPQNGRRPWARRKWGKPGGGSEWLQKKHSQSEAGRI